MSTTNICSKDYELSALIEMWNVTKENSVEKEAYYDELIEKAAVNKLLDIQDMLRELLRVMLLTEIPRIGSAANGNKFVLEDSGLYRKQSGGTILFEGNVNYDKERILKYKEKSQDYYESEQNYFYYIINCTDSFLYLWESEKFYEKLRNCLIHEINQRITTFNKKVKSCKARYESLTKSNN